MTEKTGEYKYVTIVYMCVCVLQAGIQSFGALCFYAIFAGFTWIFLTKVISGCV